MSRTSQQWTQKSEQSGSALIFSLVIMAVITVVAMLSMQRTTLQARMIANLQHQQTVFNAAFSELSSFLGSIDEPAEYDDAADTLGILIMQENNNVAQGQPYGLIRYNPYDAGVIQPPATAKIIGGSTIRVRMLRDPEMTKFDAQSNEGNSAGGTKFKYYMAAASSSSTLNQTMTASQEAGFYLEAVSPNQ